MGIINLTNDSFYAASRIAGEKTLMRHVSQMIAEGVDILDLGAYSSRSGANEVEESRELTLLLDAISLIRKEYAKIPISIDTFRSKIAAETCEKGADIVNDISGGEADKQMFETVAQLQVPYILMHMRGTPKSMQSLTEYDDLLKDITFYFSEKIAQLHALGLNDVILDPGFGFAKTLTQNYELLRNLDYFKQLEQPLLVGMSRKSMIYNLLNIDAGEALNGSTALHMYALQKGADILRVHDVAEAKQVTELFEMLKD